MKLKGLLLALASLASSNALAANDAYGTVSELITRSGADGDNAIYFRLNVIQENSTFESCILDGGNLTWVLDLSSPVANYQYELLQKSYAEQLPVRLIGYDDVCDDGQTDTDKIFELSPWSWSSHTATSE